MSNNTNSNNTIIGGSNNTVTSTCSSIIGGQGSISTCGSIGIGGYIKTQGQAGYQIKDWKEDIMNKYHNRFIIKTDYDTMSFAPTNIITDTKTNKEYEFKPQSMSNIVEETEKFIQELIIIIRDEKITNIFDASKD
jgi:nitric oxide reductase large subunit